MILKVDSKRNQIFFFPENQGAVWLKDSAGDSGNKMLLKPEDLEEDGLKKAHIEKDFIAFCSSTPGNGFLCRTDFRDSNRETHSILLKYEYQCLFLGETFGDQVSFFRVTQSRCPYS